MEHAQSGEMVGMTLDVSKSWVENFVVRARPAIGHRVTTERVLSPDPRSHAFIKVQITAGCSPGSLV